VQAALLAKEGTHVDTGIHVFCLELDGCEGHAPTRLHSKEQPACFMLGEWARAVCACTRVS